MTDDFRAREPGPDDGVPQADEEIHGAGDPPRYPMADATRLC